MLKYNVVRDSYVNEISKGLCHFQHNEEFVDMTIAVDGHMIKVHKNVIALASPYLREILKSVPCSHPVLFLNDIKHDVLCSILEYIYMGTVVVTEDKMCQFMAVAKNLQIATLNHFLITKEKKSAQIHCNVETPTPEIPTEESTPEVSLGQSKDLDTKPVTILPLVLKRNKSQCSKTNSKSNLQNTATSHLSTTQASHTKAGFQNTSVRYKNPNPAVTSAVVDTLQLFANDEPMEFAASTAQQPPLHINITLDENGLSTVNLINDANNISDPTQLQATQPNAIHNKQTESSGDQTNASGCKVDTIKYTLSKRGSLQMILNRFMYSQHHTSSAGQKRRWRCIDYRCAGCQAYVDTLGDQLVARENPHKHGFHDDIIADKAKRNIFFTSLHQAKVASQEEKDIQQRAQQNLQAEMYLTV